MAKNLSALLAQKLAENTQRHIEAQQESSFDAGRQHTKLALDLIEPNPYQPRQAFDENELQALANSIAESGLLQPVTVRPLAEGRYQLVAGERRLRAHRLLGQGSIEAIVTPLADDEMAVLALAENLSRADLTDYEIGKALRQVENVFPSRKKLAEAVGLDREDMYRYFAFEALPDHLRDRLDVNPRLLSRSAAAEIKRILAHYENDPQALHYLDEGWQKLESGTLEQTKLAAYVARALEAWLRDGCAAPSENPSANVGLMRSGKKIGSFSRDEKNVVLRVKANALTEAELKRLQQLVEEMFAERV